MKLSQMFPRRYATGEDLQGQPVTLTITKVAREKMHLQPNASEVERWVIYFKEAQKGVILSRTLAYQVGEAVGDEETDHWVGKRVTLYPQTMMVAGKRVTAIRARSDDPGKDQSPGNIAEEDESEYRIWKD